MASLLLSTGKYLHTAYAVSNIAEEFTNDDWSLSSQEGFGYIGQYIDDSAVDSSDPTDYVWTEFLDEDVDDLDDEGDMPMADFQSQIDALQDQIEVLQGDAENLQSSIEVNASNVADSAQLASEAADIANATGQYFWHDANGAHVSTEENNPEGERNSIWNSLGMLFRKGATNLLAVLAGGASGTDPKGIAVYDGQGNDDENIVASFTDSGSVIGKHGGSRTIVGNNYISMINSEGVETFRINNADGNKYVQEVNESYFIYVNKQRPQTVTLFNNAIPPDGESFGIDGLRSDGSGASPSIDFNFWFYAGTPETKSQTFTLNNGNGTITIAYDGSRGIEVSLSATEEFDALITKTSFVVLSDAPAFTLGSRTKNQQMGANSLTVGTDLYTNAQNSVVVGQYNDATGVSFFTVGCGTSDAVDERANALDVRGYGSFNETVVTGVLDVRKRQYKNLNTGGDILAEGSITADGDITANNLTGSQTADYTGSYKMGNCTILTGSVTINVTTANTNTDKAVSFGETFKHTPCIQCTMLNIGGSYYQRVTAAGPSTTGFTARIRAGGTPGNVIVNWVAIGELA